MRTVWSFLLALVMSVIASQLVAQQLAIAFHSREEFIAVMALLLLFAFICIVVLSLVFVATHGATTALHRTAVSLSMLALLATGAATIYGMSQSAWAWPSPYDLKLIAEIVCPALIVVVTQWWFVRKRFARGAV